MIDLHRSLQAAGLHRWHHHPHWQLRECGETDGHHSHGAALIAYALFPDHPEVMLTMILHDLGESAAGRGPGDVAYPAKVDSPELSLVVNEAEAKALSNLGIKLPELIDDEPEMVNLCDRLHSIWVMLDRCPALAHSVPWAKQIATCVMVATQLNVFNQVVKLLESAASQLDIKALAEPPVVREPGDPLPGTV